MNRNIRLAVAALAVSLAVPALADPAQDCTVCRDPMWPTLENPMPPIPLYAAPSPVGPSGIAKTNTAYTADARSNGVGVSAEAVAGTSAYSDPLWPQVKSIPAGMAAVSPAAPVPPAAKPAKASASAPVASR